MSRRLVRRDDSSHASLALVIPVGLFGGGMLALATATGKARWLVEHLPLTPTPNGFALLLLTLLAGGTWWRLTRIDTPAHPQLELPARDNEKWPDVEPPIDPGSPWFGTAPFTEAPQPRKVHPLFTAEDLDPDPEQLAPTLLPRRARPERRVRS